MLVGILSRCHYIVMRDENKIKQFGRNLCAERNRAGLSQEGLGSLVGLEGSYISLIERGEVNPTLTTIIPILEALKLPFEALYKTNIN